MKAKRGLRLVLMTIVAAGLIGAGCGNGGSSDCTSDNDCAAGEYCSPDTNTCVQLGTFRARLIDFASGRRDPVPRPGVTVKALNNDTGAELGMETTSDSNGWVEFEGLPDAVVGFLAIGTVGASKDTYQFHLNSMAQDEILWLVDNNTYVMAPALAGVTIDPAKGVAAGAMYWVDPAGDEWPVGCSTVQPDPDVGQVRYFGDNDLPTKLSADDPDFGRDDVNPLNGYWLIANLDPGTTNVATSLGGKEIGSTSFVVFPDSVAIGNMYTETDQQPAECQPDPECQTCD